MVDVAARTGLVWDPERVTEAVSGGRICIRTALENGACRSASAAADVQHVGEMPAWHLAARVASRSAARGRHRVDVETPSPTRSRPTRVSRGMISMCQW